MSDTTGGFFKRLAERGYEPLLHNVSGTFRWEIEDAGSWFVVVDNGSLTVSRDAVEADCAIVCSKEDFERLVVGKQNPTTLLMQGKMMVTGDLALVQMFQRLFPDKSLSSSDKGEING